MSLQVPNEGFTFSPQRKGPAIWSLLVDGHRIAGNSIASLTFAGGELPV